MYGITCHLDLAYHDPLEVISYLKENLKIEDTRCNVVADDSRLTIYIKYESEKYQEDIYNILKDCESYTNQMLRRRDKD